MDKKRLIVGYSKVYMILFWGLLLAIVGTFMIFMANSKAKARKTLREAKNVRIAMKMMALEDIGVNSTLYDENNDNGLVEGASEKLKNLSKADGEVTLISWNKKDTDADAFTYQNGMYIVHFNRNSKVQWKVYYNYKILEF